jgi:ketosteroid isomerase-like protein
MKTILLVGVSALLGITATAASAGEPSPDTPAPAIAAHPLEVGSDIAGVAAEAVAVVDAFSLALIRGDLNAASQYLDPAVLIFEQGGSERTAAEYLGGHGKADVRFLRGMRQKLVHRKAGASGDLAWVLTEREVEGQSDGEPLTLYSTETMVLRRAPSGRWSIVHIHWSSRRTTPGTSH